MKTTSNHIPFYFSRCIFLGIMLFTLLFSGISPVTAQSTGSDAITAKIDAFVKAQLQANNLKGAAVAIVRGQEIIHLSGYGELSDGQPVTPQTLFPIASGSKGFVTLAIMQLVESGQVELDAPVQKYLPWWRIADENVSAALTIRDLMNMVSGVVAGPNYDDPSMSNRLPAETSLEAAVRDLQTAKLTADPRTRVLYFDPNIWTLALIVEKISGQSYSDYLQQNILQPLAMNNTRTTAGGVDGLPDGYLTFFGRSVKYNETIDQAYLVGCCGVLSTAEDIAHYLIAQLGDGSYAGKRVLSAENIQLMHTPYPDVEPFMGMGYGMGWFVEEKDGLLRYEAPGDWATYHADLVLLPERGYGIAVMYNAGGMLTNLAFPGMVDGIAAILNDEEPETSFFNNQVIGIIVAVLALVTLGLSARALIGLRTYKRRLNKMSTAKKVGSLAWPMLLTAFLLVGYPNLISLLMLKTYPLQAALLWTPDLTGWFILLAAVNVVLAGTRAWIMIRNPRIHSA